MSASTSTAARRAHSADMVAFDHLPTCGRCQDLNHPDARKCEGCGASLYAKGATPPKPLAVVNSERPAGLTPEQRYWKERYTDSEIGQLAGWVA